MYIIEVQLFRAFFSYNYLSEFVKPEMCLNEAVKKTISHTKKKCYSNSHKRSFDVKTSKYLSNFLT